MTIKKISFKNMVRLSTYFAIGGIRLYDKDNNLIPILFPIQNQTIANSFTGGATGTVNTSNSYSSYYYVDSPFDSTKTQTGGYGSLGYWLSSVANEISITFDDELDDLSRIEYVPKPDASYTDRHLKSLTIELSDEDGEIIYSENIDTTDFAVNTVQSLNVSEYVVRRKLLLKSNNKLYSIKSKKAYHSFNMTSNTTPAPYVVSASHESSPAWNAFNSNGSYWYATSTAPSGGHWIQIKLGEKTRFTGVTIQTQAVSGTSFGVKNFKILGSLDGVIFEELFSGTHPNNGSSYTYEIQNNKEYLYYRVQGNSYYASNYYMLITNLKFFESTLFLSQVPSSTIKNLKDYGVRRIVNFNIVTINKNYILQDIVSENTDGLWVQEIDRKPLSIKFE